MKKLIPLLLNNLVLWNQFIVCSFRFLNESLICFMKLFTQSYSNWLPQSLTILRLSMVPAFILRNNSFALFQYNPSPMGSFKVGFSRVFIGFHIVPWKKSFFCFKFFYIVRWNPLIVPPSRFLNESSICFMNLLTLSYSSMALYKFDLCKALNGSGICFTKQLICSVSPEP